MNVIHKDTHSAAKTIAAHLHADAGHLRSLEPVVLNPAPGQEDFSSLLKAARVRPTDEIDEAPTCLSIDYDGNSAVIATMGNISTIAGPAKSKKTFGVSVAVAAAVSRRTMLGRIRGHLPEGQQTVILFDTEQSRHHVLKLVKRIGRLIGTDNPSNLIVYSLRPYAPSDRQRMIEFALHNTPELGLVVIDGVRDLAVDPVLDSEQASEIMTHLLQWSERLSIHIMCVLHQNKSDGNLRGHIGTELVNKSETVISVSRDPNDREISIVAPKYCRDKEFDNFSFSVDDTGLPFLVDYAPGAEADLSNSNLAGHKIPKLTIDTMKPDVVKAIVNRAFSVEKELQYSQLLINLQEACQHTAGTTLGKSRAEQFIRGLGLQGQVEKFTPNHSRYVHYRIPVD